MAFFFLLEFSPQVCVLVSHHMWPGDWTSPTSSDDSFRGLHSRSSRQDSFCPVGVLEPDSAGGSRDQVSFPLQKGFRREGWSKKCLVVKVNR